MFPSRTNAYVRKKRSENPEKFRAWNRKWNLDNPGKKKETDLRHYEGIKAQRDAEYRELVVRSILNGDVTRWVVWWWFRMFRFRAAQKMRSKKYYDSNRALMNKQSVAWQRKNRPEKYRKDPKFRLACNLRARLRAALKGGIKSQATLELLGCELPFLVSYLEKKFKPGMTWKNHGKLWHVDHKIACANFDLTDPLQQQECFNYSNLQPLWAKENLSKGAR